MKRLYLLILILFFVSCEPEFKQCEIETNDTILKAYNDILNEIITRQTFNQYLGQDGKRNI